MKQKSQKDYLSKLKRKLRKIESGSFKCSREDKKALIAKIAELEGK